MALVTLLSPVYDDVVEPDHFEPVIINGHLTESQVREVARQLGGCEGGGYNYDRESVEQTGYGFFVRFYRNEDSKEPDSRLAYYVYHLEMEELEDSKPIPVFVPGSSPRTR